MFSMVNSNTNKKNYIVYKEKTHKNKQTNKLFTNKAISELQYYFILL